MRLVLQPADDAAHGAWLRRMPGAYEWWYFDALSDDGVWALTCIWFLGNPFSPFYRMASRGENADPYDHNAVFFALYREGRLQTYHFTRFARDQVYADEARPATLRFGPNTAEGDEGSITLHLADENANRRMLAAHLVFTAPPLIAQTTKDAASPDAHSWLPAMPACRVGGQITLRGLHDTEAKRMTFQGHGYHDHNWGTLPFEAAIHDWYWARVRLGEGQALILYHIRYRGQASPIVHLLHFDQGRLTFYDPQVQVMLRRFRVNGFGMPYATQLDIQSGDKSARFQFRARLDSAPFYVRTLCEATWTENGHTQRGVGLGEYLHPHMLGWPLVASATKARIMER